MVEKKPVKTVTKKKKPTADDLILGRTFENETKKVIAYDSEDVTYKVHNLKLNNAPSIFTGDVIETFIGNRNNEARVKLIEGAKEVITKDFYGNDEYKIEVMD